jgi:hypothetical protein
MHEALSGRLPSSRVSLQRHIRLKKWLRRIPMACLMRWLEVSKGECHEQFEELTLLQNQGSELCLAIVGPPKVRNPLSEGMRVATFLHTEMARELAMLRTTVSSAVESMLGRSPGETFRVEVVGEQVDEFWRLDERCSWLERPGARIYDLLLGPPPNRARLANHLDEGARQLGVELAARREVDTELEAPQTTLSHFSELEAELELLEYWCSTVLTEDQVDALWILARPA